MIEIKDLQKRYGKSQEYALDIQSLNIQENSIVALVGENGSGKSTLLRLISGVYQAESGSITLNGESIYENENIKKDMIFIPDNPPYNANMTISYVYDFYHTFYQMDKKRFEEYLEMFSLPKAGKLSAFSKGMRRRVYIAVALAISPRILLLDEAFDGLDPKGKLLFKQEIIKQIETHPMMVIISSHSLREIEDISDQYIILEKGKIMSTGNVTENSEGIHKFLVGFTSPFSRSLFQDTRILKIDGNEKIFTVYAKGEADELAQYFQSFGPAVLEESTPTFEEIFLCTMGNSKHE